MSYKLVRYRADNLIGYESGLMTKSVDLDLWEVYDYDILAVIGENGKGKSVFLSTLSPLHTPTDTRKNFIKPNKEGLLIKEYYSKEENTLIRVKHIFVPNKKGHSAKAYFQICKNVFSKDDLGEIRELNPDGNISSYMALLKLYFGIDKNFISLASYNEDIKGMVKMTSAERFDCIRTIIPNTDRLMNVYENLNNKYKDSRAIIRSISDKISRIRPESTLLSELNRVERDINKLNKDRDSSNSKLSLLSGRIKEIQSGVDEDIVSYCNSLSVDKRRLEKELEESEKRLLKLKKSMGYSKSDDLLKKEKNLITKLSSSKSRLTIYQDRRDSILEEIYKAENEVLEAEAALYSYNNFNTDELESLVNDIKTRIYSLEYSKQKDKYQTKDFKEAESFLTLLNTLDSGLSAIDENYDGILRDVFNNKTFLNCEEPMTFIYDQNMIRHRITDLNTAIMKLDSKYNTTHREIVEINTTMKLEERLKYRPANCTIDDCAFIKDAIKAVELKPTLKVLQNELEELSSNKNNLVRELEFINNLHLALSSYETLRPIIINSSYLFDKYLGVGLKKFFKHYANNELFEAIQLFEYDIKAQMEILSQKDLYINLMTETLPETESLLKKAQEDKNIIQTLEDKIKKLNKSLVKLRAEYKETRFIVSTEQRMINEFTEEFDNLSEFILLDASHNSVVEAFNTIKDNYRYYSDKAEKITGYTRNIELLKAELRLIDDEFKPLIIKRDSLRFEQIELASLNQEKAIIEKDFAVYDILRGFVQPGKKIWKILSQIYMHDVKTTTNLLLETTFDGNLFLDDIDLEEDFIIPFTYNGYSSKDVSYASASQQTTMSNCLSLAMISVLLQKYGIITVDEIDKDLSPANKASFITTFTNNIKKMGINQAFISTHNLEYYTELENVAFITFPGSKLPSKYKYKSLNII